MTLSSYKCCTRMLVFTRKRNLLIAVSTEERLMQGSRRGKKGKRGGRDRGRMRPWDQGFRGPVASWPCLFAWLLAKHSSEVSVGDNPILQKTNEAESYS